MQVQDLQLITVCIIGFAMCVSVLSNLFITSHRNNKDVERIRELEEENYELRVKLAKLKKPLSELQEQIQKFNQAVEDIEEKVDDDVSEDSEEEFEEESKESEESDDDGDDDVTDNKKESSEEETCKVPNENTVTYRYKLRSTTRPTFMYDK